MKCVTKRAFVLASGPSLTAEHLEAVRRQPGLKIAVNSTIFSAPWADICFAADHHWWAMYHQQVKALPCERWSFSQNCAQFGARIVKKNPKRQPLTDGVAAGTSGTAAAEFAYLRGADEIVLLGVDCKVTDKTHHFGDHPEGLSNPKPNALATFAAEWRDFAAHNDVRLINVSPICELDCFEYMTLDEYLTPTGGENGHS